MVEFLSMRLLVAISTLLLIGCDSARIAKLEKENQELTSKLNVRATSASLALKRECSQQAERTFRENGLKKYPLAAQTNHYNLALNKCFIQITDTDFSTARPKIITTKSIWDAFEQKEFAAYTMFSNDINPVECHVVSPTGQKQVCHSMEEFDALAREFMDK